MEIDKIINEIKERVQELYPDLIGAYLYGSRVKGNFHKDSDLDILLLFKDVTRNKKFEIYGIISYLEYKYDVFIDIRMLTPIEFERNPFYYEQVTRYGIYYG